MWHLRRWNMCWRKLSLFILILVLEQRKWCHVNQWLGHISLIFLLDARITHNLWQCNAILPKHIQLTRANAVILEEPKIHTSSLLLLVISMAQCIRKDNTNKVSHLRIHPTFIASPLYNTRGHTIYNTFILYYGRSYPTWLEWCENW